MSAQTASPSVAVATTMAGLRATEWREDRMPPGASVTIHTLRTADGASVTGYLFRRGGERTVVCSLHPREVVVASYMVPEVLRGGCAMWVLGPRSPGNDLRLEHETALLDLDAGQRFLREVAGFEHCVLQGTSGGGPLAVFYCQQAALLAQERIARSPGGRPVRLAEAAMPPPDGVMLVSSHLGQGQLMLAGIDPAVTDEADPLASDDALSAFNPANGFARPPHPSSYDAAFLARYRAAQRERVARIGLIRLEATCPAGSWSRPACSRAPRASAVQEAAKRHRRAASWTARTRRYARRVGKIALHLRAYEASHPPASA